MHRRSSGIALAALLSLTGCSEPPPAATPPALPSAAQGWNVLLLTLDTVRADRLGAYGYDRRRSSPRLDGLIGQGVRFELALAPRSTTWPSLASVLTGLYPRTHGVTDNGYELPDDLATLPKALGAAGYQTAAVLSNMCRANHQGWDEFSCTKGVDGQIAPRALAWLDARDRNRPFLLWTHFFGAHSPYYNGSDLAARELDPGYDGPVAPRKRWLNRIMTEGISLTPRDLEHLDAVYDAAVMGTDRLIARLLDELEARGELKRTVIVLLADHGEDLYDHHRYLYHACSVYQTSLHVPLAVIAPGLLPAGAAVASTVELIDVAPTVFALLGLPTPEGTQGLSLLPLIGAPTPPAPARAAYSEYGYERIHTVVADGWKLVVNPDGITPYCFEGAPRDLYPIAERELYDLAADPQERRNLAAEHPERVARLEGMIHQKFVDLPDRRQAQNLPEELKEELRALGYVAP